VYDPIFLKHEDPHYRHVEAPERLSRIVEVLTESGVLAQMTPIQATPADHDLLTAVHHEDYVQRVQRLSEGGGRLDGETYVARGSYEIALLAAGGLVAAVDAVLDGEADNAIALVRPPGHHAFPDHGEGFCVFNNAAIAAHHAIEKRGLERVLIVDFDVHHGNGTERIFYDDPRALYFSTHQWGIYPGSGHWRSVGTGPGEGYTVNVPLPAGVGDEGFAAIFDELLYPIAERYQPQLILVSAGFDAHWADPLAMLMLTVSGYSHLARTLRSLADEVCAGRLVYTLEGGYNLDALGYGVLACVRALLGDSTVEDPLGPARGQEVSIQDLIEHLKGVHRLV
jgi:acetoin utilization deacetylase AcuC-like enzyme